ncbi:MAG: radical SAM protein [Thermoplasmata archaeon]|nr:radical SAM protein [Thermoplasmata archaeon]
MKINEIFYSLQGEGSDAGLPTIFIRFTGCNLRCNYCDTRYAFYEGKYMAIDEIMESIKKWSCKRVCITGGEPLLQKNVYTLIDELLKEGYEVSIETNGSISIMKLSKMNVKIKMDIKLPSSGMHDKMLFGNISLLRGSDELKFIIWNKQDYEYAKDIIARYKPRCQIIMQPVWGSKIKLADWILKDEIDARFSIQLHKILWGNERGK